MKKVLFLGLLSLDFKGKPEKFSHLERKYEGLSKKIVPFIVGRGKPFHTRRWNTEFYLIPEGFFVWPVAFIVAFYLCLTKKIDVIVAQSPLVEGFVATILKKIFNKELIIEIHGDWKEGPFLSKKRKFEVFQRKIAPNLSKISLKNADKIRGVANYLIEEAKKIAPQKKYFLFPTFTDLELFFEEREVNYQKFILSVGQLEQVKGMDVLIEAFSKIRDEFPQFRLVIIGEGSERKNLEARVKNLGLERKIDFVGRLPLQETKDIMKKCYCLILASLSEGLPRVLMEAMALRKPVLASRVGGIPALVKEKESGFLFEAGDASELAVKLRILLKDVNLARGMGEKGKQFVQENFSSEKYVQNYVSLIEA